MDKSQNQNVDNIKYTILCSKFKNRHLKNIDIDKILYGKACGSYTWIYFVSGNKVKVSCRLKKVEESLNSKDIIRIHHSYLVNFNHIFEIIENKQYSVRLINGIEIKVSERKFKMLLEQSFQKI